MSDFVAREKIIIRFCWHKKMCVDSVLLVTCSRNKIRKKEKLGIIVPVVVVINKIAILIGK